MPDGKVEDFRTKIGTNNLSYGAAYHPYLQTTLQLHLRRHQRHARSRGTLDAQVDQHRALQSSQARLTLEWVTLPPSAAVAGVYAGVDRDRGVWKAPANVSVAATIGPVVKIASDEQETLNVDSSAGKSINAIRAFTGKGTLVWGAGRLPATTTSGATYRCGACF